LYMPLGLQNQRTQGGASGFLLHCRKMVLWTEEYGFL
jgi:hypothetical protein